MLNVKYIIGVDGGGTKTTAVLADEGGGILSIGKGGPSNIRNVGLEVAVDNIFNAIKEVKKEENVSCYCIALASVEEEQEVKKEAIIRMLKEKGLEGEIFIESDQLSAFKAGTDENDGVVIIAGTGAVCRGWRSYKEHKTSGWGYLAGEGSAFYAGIETYRAVQKSFDGRGEKTKMEEILKEEWGVESASDFNKKIYPNFMEALPQLSIVLDRAEQQGDYVARNILEKISDELFLSAKTVIEKLDFRKVKFPVVLSGGMFKSDLLKESLSNKILMFVPKVEVIILKEDPVKGAVKMAMRFDN
ncbi:MAG: BadF/BadG/BcrA/BcrD ATPase family protein [Patescibacteria group bacterium]|nr:BadF/BadG/BcrA/BcrD ATPase family protein [Patescibacteria group bacterium]